MRRFWEPFSRDLERAEVEMRDVKREERPTDLVCEKCGQGMVIKWGRLGEFLACRGYPECKNTMNFTRADDGTIRPAEPETTAEVCEKCGQPMQVRFGRYGKFLGCSGYPACRNMQPFHKPVATGVKCLACEGGEMMQRRSRRGKTFYGCSRYPDCQFVAWDTPVPEPCPRCDAGFVTEKVTKRYGTVRRCPREGCGWQEQLDGGEGYAPLPERRAAAQVARRRGGGKGKAAGASKTTGAAAPRRTSRRASSRRATST
jgi:DNA topoisomerase-1